MINLSRRWFVFGSAAAVASLAVPKGVFLPEPIVEPAITGHAFLQRRVGELNFGFGAIPPGAENSAAVLELWARDRRVFGPLVMSVRGMFRWKALIGGEIIILPGEVLRLDVVSERVEAFAEIYCDDKVDDGPPVEVVERYSFPQVEPVLSAFLNPDNSRAARDEREKSRAQVALEEALEPWGDDLDALELLDDDEGA